MTISRRHVLEALGAGAALGTVGTLASPAGATPPADGVEDRLDRLGRVLGDPVRVFVHPESGATRAVLDAVDAVGGEVLYDYDNFAFVAAAIPEGTRDTLAGTTGVAFVEDDGSVGVPGGWDPSLPDLLGGGDPDCTAHPPQQSSWGRDRIGADDIEETGDGADVAVLDTGIQTDHCSLSVAGGRDVTGSGLPDDYEDEHGHGTHVAGIVGALDNDLGVVGTAPAADLYAVKVLNDDGSGTYSALVAGIDWCVSNDVEVLAMSLGGEAESDSVSQAIEEATDTGHLLVGSAGNEGNEGPDACDAETMTFPATHPDVLAVTAMDQDDTLASYSSVGSAVDLLAPGSNVLSTYVDNEYARASGTSMACPYVAGVAALVWATRPESGPGPNDAVRDALIGTADTVLDACAEGHGLVNAPGAIEAAGGENGGGGGSGDGGSGGDGDDGGDGTGGGGDGDGGTAPEDSDPRGLLARLLDWLRRLFGG